MKQIISLQLETSVVEQLKHIAEKQDRTVSSFLRVIINDYLEKTHEKI